MREQSEERKRIKGKAVQRCLTYSNLTFVFSFFPQERSFLPLLLLWERTFQTIGSVSLRIKIKFLS